MSNKVTSSLMKSYVIPAVLLFIPGLRWVGVYLLWRNLVRDNVIPGLKRKTFSLALLCVIIGVLILLLKWSKYIALTILIGGAAVMGLGYLGKRRDASDEKYKTVIGDKAYVKFEMLAGIMGCSEKKLIRTLEHMIERGVLGKGAYLDMGRRILVLKPEEVFPEDLEPEPQEEKETDAAAADEFDAFLKEIDRYNRRIKDPVVSAKIDRIHVVAADIFTCVRDNPEKQQQIRSFSNYYLPTTSKILATYAELEKQSAAGENIRGTKEKIEGILDTLITAYEQQLDLLFGAQAMDISTDIDVLETMMAKDGLGGGANTHKVELKL